MRNILGLGMLEAMHLSFYACHDTCLPQAPVHACAVAFPRTDFQLFVLRIYAAGSPRSVYKKGHC